MTPESSYAWKVVAVVAAAAVLVAAPLFFYKKYDEYRDSKAAAPKKEYIAAAGAEAAIDYGTLTEKLVQAIAAAPTPEQKGYLGVLLIQETQQADPENRALMLDSVRKLREIVVENLYSTTARAYAYRMIGDFLSNHLSKSLVAEIEGADIFTGPVFEEFYAEKDLVLAIARVYERASLMFAGGNPYDLLAANAIPSYRAADGYFTKLLTDASLSAASKQELYESAARELERGDGFLATLKYAFEPMPPEQRSAWSHIERRNTGQALHSKGNALAKRYLLKSKGTADEREAAAAAYEEALAAFGAHRAFTVRKAEMLARLDYAHFLAETGGAAAAGKIKPLLDPLYSDQAASERVPFLLENEASFASARSTGTPYRRRGIMLLARADERLRALAKASGWTDAMLAEQLPPLSTYAPAR